MAHQCPWFPVVGRAADGAEWSERDRAAVIPGLAALPPRRSLAAAVGNGREAANRQPSDPRRYRPRPTLPAGAKVTRKRERLMLELAETRRMLTTVEERARQAETVAVFAAAREPGQPTAARPQVAHRPHARRWIRR